MIFDQNNILLPKNTPGFKIVCMNSVSVSVSVIEVIVVIVEIAEIKRLTDSISDNIT